MLDYSPTLVVLICGTFVVAGLVKGFTGMGLQIVAMGLLASAMPPATAAALLVIPSLVTNLWQLFNGPALAVLAKRLWPMMLGIVVGTMAGATVIVKADPQWSGLGLGLALVIYAVYALRTPDLHVSAACERWASPIVGVTTGAVTGATGVFVMPAVPYLQGLRLERDALVQALGLSFTVSTVAMGAGLATQGALHGQQLGLSLLAIVPALLGMWLGQKLRARVSPVSFRRYFLFFLIVLGLELVSRPFT